VRQDPAPTGEDAPAIPHALVVSECQDRLEVQGRIVRRHFWRRLLPGVGVTSYMLVSVAVGPSAPALIVTGLFGLFTAREVVKFRSNLTTLRGREAELATLMEMEPAESPPPDHDPPDGRAEGEDDRDDR